jgi:hypothetical protein
MNNDVAMLVHQSVLYFIKLHTKVCGSILPQILSCLFFETKGLELAIILFCGDGAEGNQGDNMFCCLYLFTSL